MNSKTILRYILLKIQNNEIKVGDKLPSKGQLKYKFLCNKQTISKIYSTLIKSNLVKFKIGRGYYLINDFEMLISYQSIVPINQYKVFKVDIKKIPLLFLKNIDEELVLVKGKGKYFFNNDIQVGMQMIFIDKKYSFIINDNFNSLIRHLAYNGVAIKHIKKNAVFINNDDGSISIQDNNIFVFSLILYDENNKRICQIYNLYSEKILQKYNQKAIYF